MPHIAPLLADQLAAIAPQDIQRLAARMAQDAFAGIFRLTLNGSAKEMEDALAEVEPRCFNWCQAGNSNEAQALRMALLISGIDQWGLAYSQTFGLNAIPGVTSLLGQLRGRLEPQLDALFQQFDLVADRRLSHPQFLGSSGETEQPGGGLKDPYCGKRRQRVRHG